MNLGRQNEMELFTEEEKTLSGFRLKKIEVLNWGTFDQKAWTFHLNKRNALLTGDIGSGKSTIVDAITTLMVPSQKITYNKAAGAEKQERSLRTYVQGNYRSSKNELGAGGKPVVLRNKNTYTVILAVFENEGFKQTVTLAQVFWQKESYKMSDRFYVVADRELNIEKHFSGFGKDIKSLRKKLRELEHVEQPMGSFKEYSAAFRRRMGIQNEQALELFYQTISMKAIGNLTDFVRTHMLEAFDVGARIQELIGHFNDLNEAHNSILKAEKQMSMLKPLIEEIDKYEKLTQRAEKFRERRGQLEQYFARLKKELLHKRINLLEKEHQSSCERIETTDEKKERLNAQREDLKFDIQRNGGDQLNRIQMEIKTLGKRKEDKFQRAQRYESISANLGLEGEQTPEGFQKNLEWATELENTLKKESEQIENSLQDAQYSSRILKDKYETLNNELHSLRTRKNNIDASQVRIRQDMCEALGIAEEDLSFVGELIRVNEKEARWEGAIERVLHNFGLSLLVPERHYSAVTEWVDQTRLRSRLVFYKVSDASRQAGSDLSSNSLVYKVSIKEQSEFYDWVYTELTHRFNYVCCETLEEFRREKMALTQQGQIKGKGFRHEKDDRHDIRDRSRYILGWSNESKIKVLEKELSQIQGDGLQYIQQIRGFQEEKEKLEQSKNELIRFGEIKGFEEINWKPLASELQDLQEKLEVLEKSTDKLKELRQQLKELEEEIYGLDKKLDELKDKRSKNEEKQESARGLLEESETIIQDAETPLDSDDIVYHDTLREEALKEHTLTVESCANSQSKVRSHIQTKIDNTDRNAAHCSNTVVKRMQSFCHEFKVETQDFDSDLDAGFEYRKLMQKLSDDDLPRFKQKFRELLKENTIREIANFQGQLHKERAAIKERVEYINQSLREIEYNKGRYICLEAEENPDREILDFKLELRACTEGTLTGAMDEKYAEEKFSQVKSIIDRFIGRAGTSEADRRWKEKVTDVRNWFVFAASERWETDDAEYEHYTDSGGKSGGQKEKLAYTVLAASLAYQFGMEWGEERSRSFRFVVIDEAFGRGSDESARFGLELFKRLNLQLLIVTPLQKIHIIDPFVQSVGYVHSPKGERSYLRNLSIQEYKEEKKKWTLQQKLNSMAQKETEIEL